MTALSNHLQAPTEPQESDLRVVGKLPFLQPNVNRLRRHLQKLRSKIPVRYSENTSTNSQADLARLALDGSTDLPTKTMSFQRRRLGGDICAIFVHAGAGYHSVQNEEVHLRACAE